MKQFLKEPLLHFLFLGAAIFGFYVLIHQRQPAVYPDRWIVVSQGEVERLLMTWQKQWQRPPTEEELKGLINENIREEVLRREAVALGLDRDDIIVRRRLAQKFEFLIEDFAALRQPTDRELTSFFNLHQERYQIPSRFSFIHIYFNSEKRGAAVKQEAESVLKRLQSEKVDQEVFRLGDSFLLGIEFEEKTSVEVEQMFGRSFADTLGKMESGEWQGPVSSGYGWHLVKIMEKTPSRNREFSEVKDQVRNDWTEEERRKTKEESYERLLARYEIKIEKPVSNFEVIRTATAQEEKK